MAAVRGALDTHAHLFEPARGGGGPARRTLVLLHGTGDDERGFAAFGRVLDPDAALLSVRGNVRENGMNRFFRRLAEGVYDMDDLARRTRELIAFLDAAFAAYAIDRAAAAAVGYSNGANIAASLMLLHPGLLRAAVLFRAMVPFEPEVTPDLSGMPVFMASGSRDQMIPPDSSGRLADLLGEAGADVDLRWRSTGHGLAYEEVAEAKEWLAGVLSGLG